VTTLAVSAAAFGQVVESKVVYLRDAGCPVVLHPPAKVGGLADTDAGPHVGALDQNPVEPRDSR
jgi:hypothetical protein